MLIALSIIPDSHFPYVRQQLKNRLSIPASSRVSRITCRSESLYRREYPASSLINNLLSSEAISISLLFSFSPPFRA
jgi:hypothetical protein